jgi:signal transduction histidine kinase
MSTWLREIQSIQPAPFDRAALEERLRLTALSLLYALGAAPALVLFILTIISIPLTLVTAGLALAWLAVPATAALAAVHRRFSGSLLGEVLEPCYADSSSVNALVRPVHWLTDGARWRDVAFLAFSATGGFALSLIPPALLAAPVTHLVLALVDGGAVWLILLFLGGPMLVVWWLITPSLVRARAQAEQGIFGSSRVARLEERVAEVASTRAETLDHSAAELRRIERDLHDGAQARMAAVGMSVGLAETLLATDPEAVAGLLREARDTTVAALEDLRSVVQGIHPPAPADRGLVGGLEALAAHIPVPVAVTLSLPDDAPLPVQSALYFAVAECLANTLKHAGASRAWLTGRSVRGVMIVQVGDDGRGGADPEGGGLSGMARRLAAFDGTVAVSSPAGGPTVITLEVPGPDPR